MKKYTFLCLLIFIFASGQGYAAGIDQGKYTLDDGNMKMTLNFMPLPDGKYFIEGSGSNKLGKTCRIGDLAELKGNKLKLGSCEMTIDLSNNKFELKDTTPCVTCEPGAYVSGTYIKQ